MRRRQLQPVEIDRIYVAYI